MPIIITSDLHFSDNPRDAYRHAFVPWVHKQAKQCNAQAILMQTTWTRKV